MKIVADENIVALTEFFAGELADKGELVTVPGREITAAQLHDADALLVRSVTQVNAELLEGTAVRFVGTATSGLDHIDQAYLRSRNIGFADAAGANANSVVEYVISAFAALQALRQVDWLHCSVGIIGAGNIGGLLARKLTSLGLQVAVYDPFLGAGKLRAGRLCDFAEVLEQDVLTLHTPLTRSGDFPTWHMFNAKVIDSLAPGKVLINAGRGAVLDNEALLARLQRAADLHAVLDTWEGEPAINPALQRQVAVGTPHIAGYSLEGKRAGTQRVFEGLRGFLGLTPPQAAVQAPALQLIELSGLQHSDPVLQLNHCILSAYSILVDHEAMQGLPTAQQPARDFDRLRRQYPVRHEFSHFAVHGAADPVLRDQLGVLGFQQG